MGAREEEVENGIFDPGTTVGKIGRWHAFDPVEGLIKGDVASSELSEQAGLVTAQLIDNEHVICGGERIVDLVCSFVTGGSEPFTFPS